MALYKLLRPFAFMLDAETAHRATVAALSIAPALSLPDFAPELEQEIAGLRFPSVRRWLY